LFSVFFASVYLIEGVDPPVAITGANTYKIPAGGTFTVDCAQGDPTFNFILGYDESGNPNFSSTATSAKIVGSPVVHDCPASFLDTASKAVKDYVLETNYVQRVKTFECGTTAENKGEVKIFCQKPSGSGASGSMKMSAIGILAVVATALLI